MIKVIQDSLQKCKTKAIDTLAAVQTPPNKTKQTMLHKPSVCL